MDEQNRPSPVDGGETYINGGEAETRPTPPVPPGENTVPPSGAFEPSPDKLSQPDAPAKEPPRSLNEANPPARLFADEKPKTPKQKAMKTVGNILFGCFLAFLALLVLLTLSGRRGGSDASLLGYSLFIVQSDSMAPDIRSGAVVVEKLKEPSEIKENDIVTYAISGTNVTHRVVEVNEKSDNYYSYITKGDANNAADPTPIPYANVKGVVLFSIPLLGMLLDFLRPPKLGLLIVVIPCFLIIVVELARLVRFTKESKTREQP